MTHWNYFRASFTRSQIMQNLFIGRHMSSIFRQAFLATFVDFRFSLSLSLSNVYLRTFGGSFGGFRIYFTYLWVPCSKVVRRVEGAMEWSPIGFVESFFYEGYEGKSYALCMFSFSGVVSVHISSFSRQKHIPAVRSVCSVLGVPVYFRSNGWYISARMAFRLRSVSPGLSARFVWFFLFFGTHFA